MERFKVSVIIPVYNTSNKLLVRCVNSILSQEYSNYECIIVDDGSTKKNAGMIEEIGQLDDRIKVFHKSNGGLGNARNFGISVCNGDYVFFLDSDDYVSPFTFETGMAMAYETNADLIVGGLLHVEEGENPGFQEKIISRKLVDSNDDKADFILHMAGIKQEKYGLSKGQTGTSACARFVRREIAVETPFQNDKYWDEDDIWNIELVKNCNNILISDICWYAYVINPNSMVRGYAGDRMEEFQVRAKQEYELIKQLWPNCIQGAYNHIWDGLLRYCRTDTFHEANPKSINNRYKDFCEAIDFDEFKETISNIDFCYENRFKYRIAKNLLKYLLLLPNKKPAFWFLKECIKRIRF